MLRRYWRVLVIPALSLLAGCYAPPTAQPETYTVSQTYAAYPPQAPDEHTMVTPVGPPVIAPVAPPAPIAEVIPAPPSGQVYWVPGHWRWNASADGHSGWVWLPGHYVMRPGTTVVWQPGYWQQSSAGYVWMEGHWQ